LPSDIAKAAFFSASEKRSCLICTSASFAFIIVNIK
jgi:hypothetical protein